MSPSGPFFLNFIFVGLGQNVFILLVCDDGEHFDPTRPNMFWHGQIN